MRKQVRITNRSDGPFKVPFKKEFLAEIQGRVKSIIPLGKKVIVPSELVEFLDFERLEYLAGKKEIKFLIRELSEQKYKEPAGKKYKKRENKVKKIDESVIVVGEYKKKEDK